MILARFYRIWEAGVETGWNLSETFTLVHVAATVPDEWILVNESSAE